MTLSKLSQWIPTVNIFNYEIALAGATYQVGRRCADNYRWFSRLSLRSSAWEGGDRIPDLPEL